MTALNKNIILCGFMGSGKSTAGKLLADELAAPFIDMDEYIETREGAAISELFERFGEQGFREREHKAILALAGEKGVVIAAGGGALLFERNVAPLRKNGLIVLLDVDFGACYDRISSSDRPLVQSNTREALMLIYNRRRPQYLAAADFILENPYDAGEAIRIIKENAGL